MNCDYHIVLATGIIVAFAYDDISSKKVATQSHTTPGLDYDASRAVDRNKATCSQTRPIGSNNPDKTVWWKVDLGGVYNIYNINILFKNYDGYVDRQRGRFAGFSLYVSNTDVSTPTDVKASTLCYKDGIVLPPLNFTTKCIKSGRYVIYYNERLNGVTYPQGYEVENVFTELCQVIVQGCSNASLYGSNCETPCPTNCRDNTCNIESGACFMCKPGWTGIQCYTKCSGGWHGVNCSQICVGHCRDNTPCNHVIGQCGGGCDAGWTGYICDKECNDGTYGYNCVSNCNGNCMNDSPCNKQTGLCDKGCKPGYTDVYCSKVCPSGHYGINCSGSCSGHCINAEPCDHVSGECTSGCQDGYSGMHCNNTCIKGYFGRNCSSVCSPHCKTCRHTDGHCSCFAGFTGYRCNAACIQSYGDNCQYPCSQHCYNKNCDRFNGTCLTACIKGFYGERCDKDIQMLRQEMSSISWIVGLSISLAVNTILITTICLMCRRKCGSKGYIFDNWCLKKSDFYQDTIVQSDEPSTYQELSVTLPKTELPYHNTTLK